MIKSKYLMNRSLNYARVRFELDGGVHADVMLYRDGPFVEFRAGQDTIPAGTPGIHCTAIRRAAMDLANS